MYCNLCGKYCRVLERHHTLGRKRDKNTYILICRECHVKLHQSNNDFQRWGRKGGLRVKEKYGNIFFRLIARRWKPKWQ